MLGLERAGPDAGYPDELVGKPIVYFAWNHSGSAEDVERDTAGLRAGPEPADHDGRQRAVSRRPDGPRPRVRLGQPLVHQEPQRQRRPAGGARRARRARRRGARRGVASRSPPSAAPSAASTRTRPPMPAARRRSTSAPTRPGPIRRLDDANRRLVPAGDGDRRARDASAATRTGTRAWARDGTRRIYGDTKLARLAALKRTWDPDNVFHVNHNVAPAPAG